MRESVRLAATFVIAFVLSFALYYTGIWLLAVVAGLVAPSALGGRYRTTLPVSFVAGLLSPLAFVETNYVARGGPAFAEAYYASVVAGLPGFTIAAVTLLISGVYCTLGAVIGVYVRRLLS